jgi:tetratricopeptide (TPR) repeat protein
MLKAADINRIYLKDYQAAGVLYEKLIAQSRRLNHPAIRLAAIALGDMYGESGDQAHAAAAYRLAGTLASGGVTGEKPTDATTRGALLRVAEQQLKSGNLAQSKRLLARIETEFPEQKLEGLYRYLRAEADHAAGRYEAAIQNYEALLQLHQWAGYRGQALEWLKSLKEGAPDFYEEKKIADYQAMIEGRLKRQQDAVAAVATNAALRAVGAPFTGYQTGFEPGENPAVTNTPPDGYRFRPSLGIDGPYTGFIEAIPKPLDARYVQFLRNITSEGWFWVELWYRDTLAPGWWPANSQIFILFYGDVGQVSQQQVFNLEPTYGEWRKVAVKLKSPVTKDGEVVINFTNCQGLYEFDGLRILPVTDRQNEALQNFIEGAHPQ